LELYSRYFFSTAWWEPCATIGRASAVCISSPIAAFGCDWGMPFGAAGCWCAPGVRITLPLLLSLLLLRTTLTATARVVGPQTFRVRLTQTRTAPRLRLPHLYMLSTQAQTSTRQQHPTARVIVNINWKCPEVVVSQRN